MEEKSTTQKAHLTYPKCFLVRIIQVEVNIFCYNVISILFVTKKKFKYSQKNNTHVICLFERRQNITERHCAC